MHSSAGTSYTTEFRQYDPRLCRWVSTDPIVKPWESPYASFANDPIYFIDPSGLNSEGPKGIIQQIKGWINRNILGRTSSGIPLVKADGKGSTPSNGGTGTVTLKTPTGTEPTDGDKTQTGGTTTTPETPTNTTGNPPTDTPPTGNTEQPPTNTTTPPVTPPPTVKNWQPFTFELYSSSPFEFNPNNGRNESVASMQSRFNNVIKLANQNPTFNIFIQGQWSAGVQFPKADLQTFNNGALGPFFGNYLTPWDGMLAMAKLTRSQLRVPNTILIGRNTNTLNPPLGYTGVTIYFYK